MVPEFETFKRYLLIEVLTFISRGRVGVVLNMSDPQNHGFQYQNALGMFGTFNDYFSIHWEFHHPK